MKKLLFLAFLWTAAVAMATPVSRQQAMRSAQQFFSEKGRAVATGNLQMAHRAPMKQDAQSAAYYVFNAADGHGFVIIAGDDRARPVLAYSDGGTFDASAIPANMQAWLDGYKAELEWLSQQSDVSSAQAKAPRRVAEASKKPVSPLLTSTWNQDSPYNDKCPAFIDGNPCVTGCVATAMAQVMYYHRANSVGETQKTIAAYQCNTNWNTSSGQFRVSVPEIPQGTTLDWDNMLDSYSGAETDAQKNAVATLLAACGASVNMNYANAINGGSSASSSLIPNALTTYFGYEAAMSYKSRANFSIAEWDNLIYNELVNNRPVIYDGQSTGGGHAFVVDGYDGDGLYHVNWGWGGMSDSYFALSVMNPKNNSGIGASSSSDGYSMSQGAVIGVQPMPFEAEPEEVTLTAKNITVSGNVITAMFQNTTSATHNVECGFGIVGDDGQVVLVAHWGYSASSVPSGSYFNNCNFTISASNFTNAGLSAGDYQLVPICKIDDEDEWILCKVSDVEYVDAQYAADGTVTLGLHAKVLDIEATEFLCPGSLIAGVSQPVDVTLSNKGDEYNGLLYFFVDGVQKGKLGLAVAAGKSAAVSFSFTPSSAGDYVLTLSLNSDGSAPIATTTVTIGEGSTEQNLSVESFVATNADPQNNKKIYGTALKGKATIKNNASSVYAGDVFVWLFANNEPSGSFSSVQSANIPVVIPAGGTADVDLSFTGLSMDLYYMISFRYGSNHNNKLGNSNFSTYSMNPGLVTWDATGNMNAIAATAGVSVPDDAVAVDLSGTGIASVTPNNNPNTLYYLGAADETPGGLSDKNVVKGSQAERIALQDGRDFYVPKTFTAEEISFTLAPAVVTNGKGGWMTLVLPFAVNEVTRGDTQQSIDWFHSRTDADKDFWMKSFAEVDGTTALFDYVAQHEANIPYIVAFPGNKWGEEYNLAGKEIVFKAPNARLAADARQIASTSVYNFVGTTTTLNDLSGIFALNASGNNFALSSSATVEPFRAYFVAKGQQGLSLPTSLSIGSVDGTTTSLLIPVAVENETVDVYNLDGTLVRKVNVRNGSIDLNGLPKGVYVVKGKKIII